jgi:hypothetical protein
MPGRNRATTTIHQEPASSCREFQHMSRGEPFYVQSILLALTWVGAYLRGSVPLLVGKPFGSAPPAVTN